jgi:hypothetical protein
MTYGLNHYLNALRNTTPHQILPTCQKTFIYNLYKPTPLQCTQHAQEKTLHSEGKIICGELQIT